MRSGQPLKLLGAQFNPYAILRELEYLHKRVNEVFTDGDLALDRTITPAGTTGNQTINKFSGTVNMAAGNTTLTVTNSFVTVDSIVLAVIRTNDSTAVLKNVVPAAGSFVIRLSAAATAETSIGFIVFN